MTEPLDTVLALTRQGGGTFEAGTYIPFKPDHGFAVGVGGVQFHEADLTVANLIRWLRAVETEYASAYIGTWLDDHTVFIDAVIYTRDRDRALAIARDNHQQAIYDFATGEAITVQENEPS